MGDPNFKAADDINMSRCNSIKRKSTVYGSGMFYCYKGLLCFCTSFTVKLSD